MHSTFTKLLVIAALLFTTAGHAQLMFDGSNILDSWSDGRLATWVDASQQYQATLLYEMQPGDVSQDFHAAVDGNQGTMVIIETTEGYVFGGYNDGTWQGSTSGYYESGLANNWLYSINSETKWPIRADRLEYGTYNRDTYGPTFGGGHDIYVNSDLSTGYCFAWGYEPETGPFEGQNLTFAGSYNSWVIASIEVWKMNTSGVAVTSYTAGCSDPLGCDYDPSIDYFTSCDYESCYGCMDPASCNYDATATINDGCDYISCNPCGDAMFAGSNIVQGAMESQLAGWLGEDYHFLATKLYDSTTDGLNSTSFHANADGVQGTITLIETTTGYVFGGFNEGTWEGPTSGYYEGGNTGNFLFSVNNDEKWPIRPDRLEYGTYNRNTYGPTFGGGHDIYLNSDMSTGYCYAWGYEPESGPFEGQNLTFAGSYNSWSVLRVEVWDVNTSGVAWDAHPGGCLDPLACNYDATATCDNGLCDYNGGCTDPAACNYDASVFCDDGSCEFVCEGCTDMAACNFDPSALTDDGSCDYLSCAGCMDAGACNYDMTATIDDGSCEFTSCAGCMDAGACNYDATATLDDGSCEFTSCAGCMDAGACNYDAAATIDDFSCEYTSCAGCMDMAACEYDPTATLDDGSCATYPGDACDDGNDLTVGDSVQGDCSCAGVLIDPDVVATQCDYPSGTYDRCDMVKADWVGAEDYRFVFTPQSGGAPLEVEQGLPNTFLLLSEVNGLQAGETYDLTVDAGYDLGLSSLYWEPGLVVTEITIALPVTAVTASDDCAVHGPHFLGDYVSAEAFVCGADKWIWTFQAAGEMPIQHVKSGAGRYLRLSAVPGLAAGQSYAVTVEAGYPDGGTTAAAAAVCIQLVGIAPGAAGGPEVDTEVAAQRDLEVAEAALYPNPNTGELVMVNLTGVQQEQVQVWIFSTTGAVVAHTTLQTTGGNVQQPLQLGGLAAGTYVVRFDIDGQPLQQTLVVAP